MYIVVRFSGETGLALIREPLVRARASESPAGNPIANRRTTVQRHVVNTNTTYGTLYAVAASPTFGGGNHLRRRLLKLVPEGFEVGRHICVDDAPCFGVVVL